MHRAYGNETMVQLATRIPKPLHRAVKVQCVRADTSVMEFVIVAVQEKLRRDAAVGGARRRTKR